MLNRVGRLTRVELMKLFAQPFFWVSLGLVVAATALAAYAARGVVDDFHRPHAVSLFASGARWGLKLAGYALVIFGAMLFAGEFDRGTIKVILTRPVTRTEVFVAKCAAGLALAGLLIGVVFAVAWGLACLLGELGPVWDAEQYVTSISAERIETYLGRAIGTAVAAVAASVFLGLFISNLVESSGYAVAMALILFIAVDAATTFVSSWGPYWTNFYPAYAFDTLSDFARGSANRWREELHERRLPLLVPLATAALCAGGGWTIFRARNITV